MKNFSVLVLILLTFSCKDEAEKSEIKSLSANEIIDKSITISGGSVIENSFVTFNFRDKFYKAKRNNGKFQFERIFKDSISEIRDVLNNLGFLRYVDGNQIEVPEELMQLYAASVNSVHYFSVLPHGLNDKSVNKKLIGEEQIKNKSYYKIKVTFDQNGGGEDFEDIFIYWINKNTYKPDYLAYSYNEDEGKGLRFREAYNERYIKGLRFVDYNNYKPEIKSPNLLDLGKYFNSNDLEMLSKIELENISVDLIDL